MGDLLSEGKTLLRARYLEWIDELGLTQATASRYVRLHALSVDRPGVIEQWKELGVAKLYRVALLDVPAQQKALKKGQRQKLLEMNHQQFSAATKRYLKRRRSVSAAMRAHGLRMKTQAWLSALRATKIGKIDDENIRSGLKRDLKAVATAANKLEREI